MKRWKQALRRLLAAALAVHLVCVLCVPGSMAKALEPRVIRVGFFAYEGYHETDANGARSGYGYELLQRMARYENVTYEYVGDGSSWNEMLQMLREGKIDLLTCVSKTPQRQREFAYSARDVGRESTVVTVRAQDTRLQAGNYAGYNGINVAMVMGDQNNAAFDAFAKEHGFSYTPVYYETSKGAHMALRNGTVMAMAGSSFRRRSGEWVLENFDEKPVYAITRLDDTQTMALVNDALEKMDRSEPGWRQELAQKYLNDTGTDSICFTAEEQACLEGLQASGITLKALVKPDRWPYSYINSQGEPEGILVEAFEQIAQRCGLKVQVLAVEDPQRYVQMVQNGEADLCIDLQDDWQAAEDYGYKLTDVYVSASRSWLTFKLKNAAPQTASAVGAVTYVADIRPSGVAFTLYDTNEECLEALRRGEVDGFYTYSYYAEKVVYDNLYNDLKSSLTGDVTRFRIGVSTDQDIRLVRILNEGIAAMDEGEMRILTEKYSDLGRQKLSPERFIRQYPWLVFTSCCAVVLLIGALVLAAMAHRAQRDAELARQEAEQANRAKSDFLARMSHDIRTPINGIVGMIEIARGHLQEPERLQWCLARMSGAADHLLSLINDVLDMAKIESGGPAGEETEPVELEPLLEDCCAILEGQMEGRSLTFRRDFAALHSPVVLASPLQLRQILLNLLSNAVKYTPDGGTIVFSARQTGSTGKDLSLEFVVRDTGIGMDAEFQKHLAEPFARSEEGRRMAQGTGLGLAITYKLVQGMGGTIGVESAPGKGSTFTVDLTLPRSEAKPRPAAPGPGTSGLAGLAVLLAEDNELNREVACTLLQEAGAAVTVAQDGREAVELAEKQRFDVVLMDIEMPVMNGLDATRAIRQLAAPERRGVPILAMTANVFADAVHQCELAGMNGHIGKPFDIRLVEQEILRCTADRKCKTPRKAEETPLLDHE